MCIYIKKKKEIVSTPVFINIFIIFEKVFGTLLNDTNLNSQVFITDV